MKYMVTNEDAVHGIIRFLRIFLLLSIIAITTYGVILHDIVVVEVGFKVAVVLLAFNALTQSMKTTIEVALSILVLLILFYSAHLYHNIIVFRTIYTAVCLLIFMMYSSKKQIYSEKPEVAYVELGVLYYVIASSAWITSEEGARWVVPLIAILLVLRIVFLPRINVLRRLCFVDSSINVIKLLYLRVNARINSVYDKIKHFIAAKTVSKERTENRITEVFKGLFKALNIMSKLGNNLSFNLDCGTRDFCKRIPSLSEVGKHIDYHLTRNSIELMKFTSIKFREVEDKVVEKLHRFSSVIERFQYLMEHTFILLLFLASTFVLIAILVYVLVVS